MEQAGDFHTVAGPDVDKDIGCSHNRQFASSSNPAWPAAFRVLSDEIGRSLDCIAQSRGRPRIRRFHIAKLSIAITLRGNRPDYPDQVYQVGVRRSSAR